MFGLGLRPPFYDAAMHGQAPVDFFEAITENFLVDGGRSLQVLESVRNHYPIALHGVSLNLGGSDELDAHYIARLKGLVERFEPNWVSDHLCWSKHRGHHFHDLLPLPFDEDTVRHVAARIARVQDIVQRRILIENVSSYVEFAPHGMREWEFLIAVAERADCRILLDLNNIVVNAHNHKFDAFEYVAAIPAPLVAQHHLAGHDRSGSFLIDTHDQPVPTDVWDLYRWAHMRFGTLPLVLERDDHIPPLESLLLELEGARHIAHHEEGLWA